MLRPILLALIALTLVACIPANETATPPNDTRSQPLNELTPPDWSRDAVIYQINTRQYSEEGTFAAVEADLPRIKALDVDILWLMPIHPIGEEKRKGTLGSPYAVKDYLGVNPELGTLADFKSLVDAVHAQDMKIIIDWVANHTAWDNPLITQHPEWYTRNEAGEMQQPPDTDWLDVADLNFDEPGLRQYMSDALAYWVEEVGIDGYRCDVAGMVPTDFWNDVTPRLNAIKPVFMLAEWQDPELHEQAFHASYAWRWKEIMQDIVKGEATAADLAGYYADYQSDWPRDAMRMAYTDNHDQNTWDGLTQEIYGDAYELAIVLQFTGEGIPLIYNGQECANPKQLEFFEKDPIVWNCDDPVNALFRDLVQLKTDNPALHNGAWGGRMVRVETSNPQAVFSFVREKDWNKVLVIANMSDEAQDFQFLNEAQYGSYLHLRTNELVNISNTELNLPAWERAVYVRR